MRWLWCSALALAGCAGPRVAPPADVDAGAPRLLEAFFGLDDALPLAAAGLCPAAPGKDGMPLTFSVRLAQRELAPGAFHVVTHSGAVHTPLCATTRPAAEASEGHTVLLIGELGSASDPPARVRVVDDLPFAGGPAGAGLEAAVTPLAAGPRLVHAFALTAAQGLECPTDDAGPSAGVVVVWSGGVVPAAGRSDDDHRRAYRVFVDGGAVPVVPVALADLGDNDNYVHVCVDVDGVIDHVDVDAGVVRDPNGDVNAGSAVRVAR